MTSCCNFHGDVSQQRDFIRFEKRRFNKRLQFLMHEIIVLISNDEIAFGNFKASRLPKADLPVWLVWGVDSRHIC